MLRELRLVIAIPSGDEWARGFGLSLAMLMSTWNRPIAPYDSMAVRIHNRKGSILPNSRQALVKMAQDFKATHILFLDSDMIFPAETARQLLSHRLYVVACNCPTKMIPATTTARVKDGTMAGKQVYTLPKSSGLQEVWRVGTGVMLIDMMVFDKIQKPYFPMDWVEEQGAFRGEDWGFCEKLEKAGISIFIDHDLSKHIKHVGEFEYSHDVVGEIVQQPVAMAG